MLIAVLSAFWGGVILNLMPCVFPIISLKALGLIKEGDAPARRRREGMAFFIGTLVAMLALATLLIALRSAGVAVGWGFQLQSPVVVTLLALLMLAAALNLFGLFELGLGLQRLGSRLDAGHGLAGAALTGALAVVVATPCAGPFMAGAIGYALVQPPALALLVFAALGAGVAAPFTLLSFSPALARRLPRPGPWMGTLKQLLAFPMLAAAAWLTWVLSQQGGSASLARLLTCAVLLGLLAWLYGLAQRRSLLGKSTWPLRLVALFGLLLMACSLGLVKQGMILGRAAPALASAANGQEPIDVAPMVWSRDEVARQQAARRPVFVDFTASWCLTCQVNEKAVLSSRVFKEALARTGTVYMVADSTNYNADIEQAMAQLGRDGLPLYLLYPADGGAPLILPQLLRKDAVVSALEAAARKS